MKKIEIKSKRDYFVLCIDDIQKCAFEWGKKRILHLHVLSNFKGLDTGDSENFYAGIIQNMEQKECVGLSFLNI